MVFVLGPIHDWTDVAWSGCTLAGAVAALTVAVAVELNRRVPLLDIRWPAQLAQAQLDDQTEAVRTATVVQDARRGDIESARAVVSLDGIALENSVIRAPVDGAMGQGAVHAGQYVTLGTARVPHVGTDLCVTADFRETAMAGLQPGSGVSLTGDALRDRALQGHGDRLSPATASAFRLMAGSAGGGTVTRIAQRLPGRALIDRGQDRVELRSGMSVVVRADG